MPLVLLGTYQIRGFDNIKASLDAALAAGYRGIDTASVYRNEEDIGKALKELLPKFGLSREDIFITSKLGPAQHGFEEAQGALDATLSALGTSYLDLYLVHWPGSQGRRPGDPDNPERRADSWRGLEAAHRRGLVRAIGVSNYLRCHLAELAACCSVSPAVLQSEMHPMLPQTDLREFCRTQGIHFQAYSSLGSTAQHNTLCEHPIVTEIAKEIGKSPAQVLLRWAVQQGVSVLPKSTQATHIVENVRLFDWTLEASTMRRLSHDLDEGRHFCWDPKLVL